MIGAISKGMYAPGLMTGEMPVRPAAGAEPRLPSRVTALAGVPPTSPFSSQSSAITVAPPRGAPLPPRSAASAAASTARREGWKSCLHGVPRWHVQQQNSSGSPLNVEVHGQSRRRHAGSTGPTAASRDAGLSSGPSSPVRSTLSSPLQPTARCRFFKQLYVPEKSPPRVLHSSCCTAVCQVRRHTSNLHLSKTGPTDEHGCSVAHAAGLRDRPHGHSGRDCPCAF